MGYFLDYDNTIPHNSYCDLVTVCKLKLKLKLKFIVNKKSYFILNFFVILYFSNISLIFYHSSGIVSQATIAEKSNSSSSSIS